MWIKADEPVLTCGHIEKYKKWFYFHVDMGAEYITTDFNVGLAKWLIACPKCAKRAKDGFGKVPIADVVSLTEDTWIEDSGIAGKIVKS